MISFLEKAKYANTYGDDGKITTIVPFRNF
ncbi:hypothetical protein DES46_1083 [Caldimonas thermodepolymerans]|jgi:hypothetical protein|nr:hypothetical protein DES46_1083 [Caldimonas thermodepolymerans]